MTLEVIDDGTGFDPQRVAFDGVLGLAGMRERIELLGGTFEVVSRESRGTRIRVCLPMTLPAGADV